MDNDRTGAMKMNNPCVTVVTRRGLYLVEALLTRKGDAVGLYTLILPDNEDVKPMFHAGDSRVPDAYTPDCDCWDTQKTCQIIDLWEERYNADGTRRDEGAR
jgi:hypothetical protein